MGFNLVVTTPKNKTTTIKHQFRGWDKIIIILKIGQLTILDMKQVN